LPNRDEYPDYYQQTAMPLSLDMIEKRLEDRYYDNLTALESDIKRMVQNAKDYNDSRSEVFADAERIRKALSNFMPRHNPAYQDPEYKAIPTPIPQSLLDRLRESSVSTVAGSNGGASGPLKIRLKSSRPSIAPSASPEAEDENIHNAMLALLEDLSGLEAAVNFEKRPPKRDYPDYYQIIARPTSIADVRTMVKQQKIANWDAFADEIRLIWRNAKEYNEPGSDIYDMTEELEEWFEEKVRATGASAPKARPRLSLSQPRKQGIKLKVGSSSATPSFVGGTVDDESLRRQKEETSRAVQASRGDSRGVATPVPSTAPSMTRSLSSVEPNGDIIMSGVNGAGPATPINLQDTIPPTKPGYLPNGAGPAQINGVKPMELPRNVRVDSNNPVERHYRDSGKGKQCALHDDNFS
jgi:hypothetical protein